MNGRIYVALKKAKEEGEDYDNYMGIGMCFGMCAGTILKRRN